MNHITLHCLPSLIVLLCVNLIGNICLRSVVSVFVACVVGVSSAELSSSMDILSSESISLIVFVSGLCQCYEVSQVHIFRMFGLDEYLSCCFPVLFLLNWGPFFAICSLVW